MHLPPNRRSRLGDSGTGRPTWPRRAPRASLGRPARLSDPHHVPRRPGRVPSVAATRSELLTVLSEHLASDRRAVADRIHAIATALTDLTRDVEPLLDDADAQHVRTLAAKAVDAVGRLASTLDEQLGGQAAKALRLAGGLGQASSPSPAPALPIPDPQPPTPARKTKVKVKPRKQQRRQAEPLDQVPQKQPLTPLRVDGPVPERYSDLWRLPPDEQQRRRAELLAMASPVVGGEVLLDNGSKLVTQLRLPKRPAKVKPT